MKRLPIYFLGSLFCINGIHGDAQGVSSQKPFELSLSVERHLTSAPPTHLGLVVTFTNTSSETIHETICATAGGLYKLVVGFNGSKLPESDYARKHREDMERGEANGGSCEGTSSQRSILPGESADNTLYYDARKEGTYTFRVERKTFPKDPQQSVIIRSNSVTVVIPEPRKD